MLLDSQVMARGWRLELPPQVHQLHVLCWLILQADEYAKDEPGGYYVPWHRMLIHGQISCHHQKGKSKWANYGERVRTLVATLSWMSTGGCLCSSGLPSDHGKDERHIQ